MGPGRRTAMREASPLRSRSPSSRATPTGLVCLSGCAREGAVAGRWERGDPTRRGGDGAAAAVGLRAGQLPGRAAAPAVAPRPRAQPLARLARRARSGCPCVATGNVHAHERSRLALQDALVAVRLGATLDESEGAAPRQHRGGADLAGPGGGALPRPPRGGRRVGAAGRAAALRPDQRPRLQLPRRRGPDRRPRAWPSSAARCWTSATSGSPDRARGRGAGWRRSSA